MTQNNAVDMAITTEREPENSVEVGDKGSTN